MAPPPSLRPNPRLSAVDAMKSMLLQTAFDGDILRFNKLAGFLDQGRARLRETVEAVTMESDDEETRGIGALHLAAGNGKLEMCRYLVEGLRMDVDTVDYQGRTPLINAIHGESLDTAKYLLEHGANQDKADRHGFTPLHSAAGLGCCEITKLLLARGAYTDPVTCCGTPLHIAATERRDCTMKILLDHNADYTKMVNGMTPLYFAINAASVKCVKLLVQAGAIANGDCFLTYLVDVPTPTNLSAQCLNCVLGVGIGSSWDDSNDNKPLDKMKIAELKSQGSKAVGRKDFLSAAEFYSMALALDPEDATLFSNRSLCWLHMGKPLLSLLDALECRKRRPDWAKACFRQSKALMWLKDYKGECEALLDALKLNPGNSEIEDALRNAMESLKMSRSTKSK